MCTMLTEIKIGSTFEPKTLTEDLKKTRVFLLLWNLIFILYLKLKSQERYKYISHLNFSNSILFLMDNFLKLIPHNMLTIMSIQLSKSCLTDKLLEQKTGIWCVGHITICYICCCSC